MQHDSVRRYHECIPPYLVNRPHPMINHALEQIEKAKNADLSGIVNAGDGKFVVTSFTSVEGTKSYDLTFGDAENMPHCSCDAWRRSSYLCKHFFAIFRKHPEWGWNKVSSLYTDSPFTTLNPGTRFRNRVRMAVRCV